ncbi:DoxX family membrane protein [bacterium]|nr:DoxX family membrane protein [bacterium]
MAAADSYKIRRWAFIAFTCRFVAGGAFLFAAFQKLAGPQKFALDINALGLVPEATVPIFAFLVPWTEIVIGICLLYGIWSRSAGWLATIVYAGFTAVLASAMIRGLDASCGCFGDSFGGGVINVYSLLRNSVFIAASLVVALGGGGPASLDAVLESTRSAEPEKVDEDEHGTLAHPAPSAE